MVKVFPTQGAAVGLLSCVNTLVSHKTSQLRESLTALATLVVQSLFDKNELIRSQLGAGRAVIFVQRVGEPSGNLYWHRRGRRGRGAGVCERQVSVQAKDWSHVFFLRHAEGREKWQQSSLFIVIIIISSSIIIISSILLLLFFDEYDNFEVIHLSSV